MTDWKSIPPEERLKMRTRVNGECIEWTGTTFHNGYGGITVNGQKKKTHRYSWELENGPIPEGMLVLHKCDNPPCINPEHLYIGTQVQNMRDREQRGRGPNSTKTHCLRGHEFDAKNTYMHRGKRKCIKCYRLRDKCRRRGIPVPEVDDA